MSEIRIGIAGATGYGGQELLRLAASHPHADVTVAMASSTADGTRSLPALTGVWSGTVAGFSIDVMAREADVVFLGLPDTTSATVGPQLLERGLRVFDLSGAFRLRSADARARWYPNTPEVDVPIRLRVDGAPS